MYTTVCMVAGLILIAGTAVVQRSLPLAAEGTLSVWGGSGASLLNPIYAPQNPVLTGMPTSSPTFGDKEPPLFMPIAPSQPDGASDDFSFDAFVAALTPASGGASAGASSDVSSSYSFIPQGLISTSAPQKKRTALQQALFDYGNDVGSRIQSYEDSHMDSVLILTDQVQNRQNAEKGQKVRDIGTALISLGFGLAQMEDVPQEVTGMHGALAKSYQDVGAKLKKVPDTGRDEEFIAATNDYNAAADAFAKNYVALATYFSLSGVVFGPTDPGNVFTFTQGGAF